MTEQTIATEGAIPETITLEAYVASAKVKAGMVASFKYEAQHNEALLTPKTSAEWAKAFLAQANAIYE